MKLIITALFATSAIFSTNVMAADIAAGKSKALVCSACHGPTGISMIPLYPNLKGQKSAYLEKQLKAFKNKTRVDPVMSAQAAALSDEDIANVAAYYESLGQ